MKRRPQGLEPPAWVRLPEGTTSYVPPESALKTHVESTLAGVFESWGYGRVLTPTFDYADQLGVGLGAELRESIMNLTHSAGRTLALRVDLTTPVARLVATRLREAPRPIRLYYVENVFRLERALTGRRREFFQAGVEHFGGADVSADGEVLLLAAEALRTLGLGGFQINLGHLGLVRAALESLRLDARDRAEVLEAIDRKDESGLSSALRTAAAPRAASAQLQRLVRLVGRGGVLKAARALRTLPGASAAVARLEALQGWIADAGLEKHVVYDFGEVRGMDYYSGMNFEVFAPGAGAPLGAGGRYDHLLGHFDLDLPAVGFAFTVEEVLAWLERSGLRPEAPRPVAVAEDGDRRAALRRAASVRARGGVATLDFGLRARRSRKPRGC